MKQATKTMKRRDFLRQAGLGTVALAAAPVLGQQLVGAASMTGQINFHFLALSTGGGAHLLLMSGNGVMTPGNVIGHGSFQHTENGVILGEGTWKAKRLIEWAPIGNFGIGFAGVLTMAIHLVPNNGPVVPATLAVTCNIPPGGLFTGNPEGYVLTIPNVLTFSPFTPPIGITWFTRAVEARD